MNRVAVILNELSECLCAEMEKYDSKLCFCGLIAGEGVYDMMGGPPYDCENEGCGQAWVRLVASYPSTIVGQQNNEVDNCGKGFGFDIEVGVLRCVNIPDEGEALDPDEMLVAANQQTDDMLSMQKAIMCCDSLNNVDFTVGVYVPAGPDGGVLGGTWSLSVLVI